MGDSLGPKGTSSGSSFVVFQSLLWECREQNYQSPVVAPEPACQNPPAASLEQPSIFVAVEEQLGLKLEPRIDPYKS